MAEPSAPTVGEVLDALRTLLDELEAEEGYWSNRVKLYALRGQAWDAESEGAECPNPGYDAAIRRAVAITGWRKGSRTDERAGGNRF